MTETDQDRRGQARWLILLAAVMATVYLCWLMLKPFVNVLMWAAATSARNEREMVLMQEAFTPSNLREGVLGRIDVPEGSWRDATGSANRADRLLVWLRLYARLAARLRESGAAGDQLPSGVVLGDERLPNPLCRPRMAYRASVYCGPARHGVRDIVFG